MGIRKEVTVVLDQREQNNLDSLEVVLHNNWVLVIDRFEGDYAVCEVLSCGKIIKIQRKYLPKNAAGNDVLKPDLSGGKLMIDVEMTAQRRKEAFAKLKNLLKSEPLA
ncbi:hypothetical protein FACS1894198_2830 [Clostridia bacterium]|nr:hypothetical protein FACS1894198_2830 [Clostridia bacterium]